MSLARSLWRILPNPTRRAISEILLRFNTVRAYDLSALRPRREYSGHRVYVAGVFQSATGVGKAAELLCQTLEATGAHVVRVDLTVALGIPVFEPGKYLAPSECVDASVTDLVVVLNPGLRHPLQSFDLAWLKDRCVIGHWIWELERLPPSWSKFVKSFDEIWVPTEHVRAAVLESIPDIKPTPRIVPYSTSNLMIVNSDRSKGRLERYRLNIPQDAFVVGYSFAAGSNYFRKNPEGLVDAFRQAFPVTADSSVCLLLRCRDLDQHPTARSRLAARIGDDRRMIVLDHESSMPIADFYATIDLYAAPFRAEGYGLNLVEASQQDIAVLATGWRLPKEIADLSNVTSISCTLIPIQDPQGHYNGIKGGRWADPDLAEFARQMANHRALHDHGDPMVHSANRPLPSLRA